MTPGTNPLDRIYKASKQKEVELQQAQIPSNHTTSEIRHTDEQESRSMFPRMIKSFYGKDLPAPPVHLVQKAVENRSEVRYTNPLDRIYKASKQKEIERQQLQ